MVKREPILTALSQEKVRTEADGTVVMSNKTLRGLQEYARHWPGTVRALFQPVEAAPPGIDDVHVAPAEQSFDLRVVPFSEPLLAEEIGAASVVMGGIGYGFTDLADLCANLDVACVYVTELTLRTRKQIVASTCRNPLLRLRRSIWASGQERRNVAALRRASGIQCNGTPTYKCYRALGPETMLFFDNRLSEALLASERDILERPNSEELRLVFSGRLTRIKGVDHLPAVAEELRRQGVRFRLYICGNGECLGDLRREFARRELDAYVEFRGVMDFASELVPFVKHSTDLFICCHRQGDPSCTYVETMGCGVPIIGYDNEALQGIVEESGAGWTVPVDMPRLLARRIAELARDRATVVEGGRASLDFAARHTFEETFLKRIKHLESVMEAKGA